MPSTASATSITFFNNSSTANVESWFIPFDIVLIVCTSIVIILATVFLFLIIVDKRCHTVPMMLIGNSCLSTLICGCSMFSLCIFTLQNDLKQIQYEDLFCVFRGYIDYVSCGLTTYSFLIQAIYRYIIVVYPNRLSWQSARFQSLIICLTWVFALIYPFAFLFPGEIVYNIDNQICQLRLRLCFSVIYAAHCVYIIPVSMIMFIYLKLVRYVHQMSKHITPVNILSHAQRELIMIRRLVILVMIIMTVGLPYGIFVIISFFTEPPKYHFRIAFLFVDLSLVFLMISLFQFTDPLKASIMKRINRRSNVVVPAIA